MKKIYAFDVAKKIQQYALFKEKYDNIRLLRECSVPIGLKIVIVIKKVRLDQ